MVVAAASMAALAAFSSTNTGAGTAMLVELRPVTACDAPALVRDAGGTLVSSALRLYRIEGRAAPAVLRGIRACGALRLAAQGRPSRPLPPTRFSAPLITAGGWGGGAGGHRP